MASRFRRRSRPSLSRCSVKFLIGSLALLQRQQLRLAAAGAPAGATASLGAPRNVAESMSRRSADDEDDTCVGGERGGEGDEVRCRASTRAESGDGRVADPSPSPVPPVLADRVFVLSAGVSEEDAAVLLDVYKRGMGHITPELLADAKARQDEEEDGEPDDVYWEASDGEQSYSVDVIDDGNCSEWPTVTPSDCDFVRRLLQRVVEPAVRQAIRLWHDQDVHWPPREIYACHSFLKSYLPGQRRHLYPHLDLSSALTANVLLNPPSQFNGGLKVYPWARPTNNERRRGIVDPSRQGAPILLERENSRLGDVVLHPGNLLHGVELLGEEDRRYTWITWFHSEPCFDPDASDNK